MRRCFQYYLLRCLGGFTDAQAMGVYTIYVSIINITQQIACFRYDYAIVVADDDDEAGGAFILSCLLAVGFSLLMAVIMWPFIPQIGEMINLNTQRNRRPFGRFR